MKIGWFFSFCIYVFVFFIDFYTSFIPMWINFILFTIICISITFFVLKKLHSKIEIEEELYKDSEWKELKIFVITVEKNEGKVILDAVDHYLSFPENVKMRIYDDNSTDGTYEKLLEKREKYHERLEILRIKSTNKVLHPKGIGVEDAFHSIEADYFFVMDADSIVSFEDFKKGLFIADRQKIDVVHLTRRNDTIESAGYRIGDTDELMMVAMKSINLIPWNFSGSGFFIKGDVAKTLHYGSSVFSEDTEIGRQLRDSNFKIEYLITLEVHERAPLTLRRSFSQRMNWLKMGIPHYLKEEKGAIFVGNFIFASFTYLPFFAFSISSTLAIGVGGFAFGLLLTVSKVLGKKSVFQSLLDVILYIVVEYITFAFIYPAMLFITPFRKHLKFSKNAV